MIRQMSIAVAALAVLSAPVLAESDSNDAPRPRSVARRCMGQIKRVTHKAVAGIGERTDRCVAEIEDLLAQGKIGAAREVAGNCAEDVKQGAERATRRINSITERCLALLEELEASPRLMNTVRRASRKAKDVVRQHAERAVRRIHEAVST